MSRKNYSVKTEPHEGRKRQAKSRKITDDWKINSLHANSDLPTMDIDALNSIYDEYWDIFPASFQTPTMAEYIDKPTDECSPLGGYHLPITTGFPGQCRELPRATQIHFAPDITTFGGDLESGIFSGDMRPCEALTISTDAGSQRVTYGAPTSLGGTTVSGHHSDDASLLPPPTDCLRTTFAHEASLHQISSFEDSVPVQKQGTVGKQAVPHFRQGRCNNSNILVNTADKVAQKRDQLRRSQSVEEAMDALLQLERRLWRENRQQIAAAMGGDHCTVNGSSEQRPNMQFLGVW